MSMKSSSPKQAFSLKDLERTVLDVKAISKGGAACHMHASAHHVHNLLGNFQWF